jgi:hypothetical protein
VRLGSPIPFRQTQSTFFIRTHNETLSVAAIRICNKDWLPVGVNRRDITPTPTGFAEIVSNDF